jgi:hypothetical protein
MKLQCLFKHSNLTSKPIKQNNNKMIGITTQFKSLENEFFKDNIEKQKIIWFSLVCLICLANFQFQHKPYSTPIYPSQIY